MRILVTGGAGYVGSRVSGHLLEAGMEVIVFDRLIYGGEGLLPHLDHPRLRVVAKDIRDQDALRAAMDSVDWVIHMAALVGEPACRVDPESTREINLGGSQFVVDLADELAVKGLLFISTCSNYGVADPNALADEDSPLRPLSLYAETKVLAEQLVLQATKRGLATCVLRLGTICGVSPRMRFNLLVNEMARSAVLGETISIYSPEAWRPFLHIRDAAEVIRYCLMSPVSSLSGQIFNVVGENYQKRQLAALVLKHFSEATVKTSNGQPDPRDYRVAAERIFQRLGFRPGHTVEQAFLEVARAVRERLFQEPHRPIYEALPDAQALKEGSTAIE